jgi:hypothetical protein
MTLLEELNKTLENLTTEHNQKLEKQTEAQLKFLSAELALNTKEASLYMPGVNPGKNDKERNAYVTTECAVEIETLHNLKQELEIAKCAYQMAYTSLQSFKMIHQSWFK